MGFWINFIAFVSGTLVARNIMTQLVRGLLLSGATKIFGVDSRVFVWVIGKICLFCGAIFICSLPEAKVDIDPIVFLLLGFLMGAH
jgi:hypothetical protein